MGVFISWCGTVVWVYSLVGVVPLCVCVFTDGCGCVSCTRSHFALASFNLTIFS